MSAADGVAAPEAFLEPFMAAQSPTRTHWDREQAVMLFHHPNLYSHMQGLQNLVFPSRIRIIISLDELILWKITARNT